MKKSLVVIALALATATIGQETSPASRSVKTEKEVRFQIVESHMMQNSPVVIKIDTMTGKTWVLRLASDTDREKNGITFIWAEIPDVNLSEEVTSAAVIRKGSPFSPEPPAPSK